MAEESDQSLIRAYARDRCESSFSELVHRHIDLVHSTALRVLRDANLAEDVTQRVFLALARHSAKLQTRLSLTGRENDVSFYRDQDGVWRRAIPAGIVEKLPHVVSGLAQGHGAGK